MKLLDNNEVSAYRNHLMRKVEELEAEGREAREAGDMDTRRALSNMRRGVQYAIDMLNSRNYMEH